jgi:uncharacterized protein (DUF58 family)
MRAILPFLTVLLAVAFVSKVDFFFYLLYTLAGIYILGRLWARRSLSNVQLHRRHDGRIFLGETLTVEVDLRNSGLLPVLWMRLHDSVPADLMPGKVFRQVVSLAPREQSSLAYQVSGRRRGFYQIGPLVVRGGDLLGATSYERTHRDEGSLIVYPKIIALRDLGLPTQSPFGTLPSRQRLFEDPARIRGVRDYQPGDSLRRMDWKTSARVGALQVRRYEPTIALETALILNLCRGDLAPPHGRQAAELGITVAASMAVHLLERRQAVSLVTNGHDPLALVPTQSPSLPLRTGREHLMHILDLLARIERSSGDEATPLLQLLGRGSLNLPWGSTVVVITPGEVAGLMDAVLALNRRGLAVALVLTVPDRDHNMTVQRARQVGARVFRIWNEQDLDVWR